MKYRKKPVAVEAMQWLGDNAMEIYNFVENKNDHKKMAVKWEGKYFRLDPSHCDLDCFPGNLAIKTLEGDRHAAVGDYIVKDINGDFYPCKPDIFEQTHKPEDSSKLMVNVSITDTDLFKDIIALLKDLSEQDETISQRLDEILSKHGRTDKEEEYGIY